METTLFYPAQTQSGFKSINKDGIIETSSGVSGHIFHTVTTSYLTEGILFHAWLGYRTDEELKEVLEKILYPILVENKCYKVLVDTSLVEGSFDGANDWLADYYMPKIITAGLRLHGMVLPADLYASLALELYQENNVKNGFDNRMFPSVEAAYAWLKTV